MLWGCWAAIDILGNSTQERTKPRKKKTDVPEELACLKCAVVVCSQVTDDHGNLFCIALNQRPSPQTADWLVTGWCSFSSIYFKGLALPSLNLKLFCNVSSYHSCYKNKSYVILNSCTMRKKKSHKIQVMDKYNLLPYYRVIEFIQHSDINLAYISKG